MPPALKIISDNGASFVVGGYAVVYGGQDVVGDRFTKSTDFWFDRLTHTPPVLYQHGKDEMVKRAVVGRVVAKESTDVGLWVEAQITAAKQYADAIRKLVEKGILGWSSGSVPHLVQRKATDDPRIAEITSWPIVEISLTPTPAEPRTIGVRELKALAERDPWLLEIAEDAELKAELDAADRNDLSAADFAYVDSSGGKHLPIHDEAHVRAAMSRFNQTHFESDDKKKAAARKILAKARSFGMDVSSDSAVAMAAKGGTPLFDLPDDAFAYVEPGMLDEERKTVPRANRHFPHHAEDGSVDIESLKSALAEAKQSKFGEKALGHLTRHARTAGLELWESPTTDDAHTEVWLEGSAPKALVLAAKMGALSEQLAADQIAQKRLGIDTKSGDRLTSASTEVLEEIYSTVGQMLEWTKSIERGEDGRMRVEMFKARLAMLQLEEVS